MRQKALYGIVTARLAGVLFALLLSTGAVVHAAPLDAREREARADFAAGRYQKAVDTFAALFAETGDPIHLRNIGRCYQKMKRPQEAIDSFQEYLHKGKNLSKAERQEIDGYIKEMEALKASEAAAPPVTPPPATTAPPPPTTATSPAGAGAPSGAGMFGVGDAPTAPPPAGSTTTTPPPALGVVASAPAAHDDGRTWRIAGIATGAAGVAFIAVGIAYGAAAKSAADSVSNQYNAGTESDGKRDATLQWVGYGVGVAALATGAILYVHGMTPPKAPEKTARLRLNGGAAFDRNGGAFLLQGSF
jgi:tetratricopeptide (TPR) repeat protein